VWERLRDEAVFDSEEELVAQIAKDVEATRKAVRPTAPASESP
jgi:FAD synthase